MEIASYKDDNIAINHMMDQVQLIQNCFTNKNQNYEDFIEMNKSLSLYIQRYQEKIKKEYYQIQRTLEEAFRIQEAESSSSQKMSNFRDFQDNVLGKSNNKNSFAEQQEARESSNQNFNIKISQKFDIERSNIKIAGGMQVSCQSENASYDKVFKNNLKNQKYSLKLNNIGLKEISQLMDGYRHPIRLGACSLSLGKLRIPKLFIASPDFYIKLPRNELPKKAESQVDFMDQRAKTLTSFVKRRQLIDTADTNATVCHQINCFEEHNLNKFLFKVKIKSMKCNYAFILVKNFRCHKNPKWVKKYFLDCQDMRTHLSNFLLRIFHCKLKAMNVRIKSLKNLTKNEILKDQKTTDFHTSLLITLIKFEKTQHLINKISSSYKSTKNYGLYHLKITKNLNYITKHFAIKIMIIKNFRIKYKFIFKLKMKGFKFNITIENFGLK